MPKATHACTLQKNQVFTVKENFKVSALPPASHLIVPIVRTDRSTAHAGDATENHANTLADVQVFAVEENFILLRRLLFHIT